MKKAIGLVSAALLVLALQTPAHGLDLRIGANANFGTTNDFGVGPRVELDLGDYVPGLRVAGDIHKFFDSQAYNDIDGRVVESNSWDAGIHVLYDFTTVAVAEGATLYAGAGLLYAKRHFAISGQLDSEGVATDKDFTKLLEKYTDDSGVSLALSVGSTFNTGWTVIPFVEARYTIGIVDELMVTAGLLFSTGLGSK